MLTFLQPIPDFFNNVRITEGGLSGDGRQFFLHFHAPN